MIGESLEMRRIERLIAKVGPRDHSVLITGESGTGKELVARAIHNASARSPFVPVDCGSLSATLVESELFGYVQGAFTGAARNKRGLVQAAEGGTLFLDEVGELPLEMQPKLLRVLQQKEVRAVGATSGESVDVRVIAATNRDLRVEVERGRFRQDLYFRLAVVVLRVPPLRERRDDIPILAEHFLRKTVDSDFDTAILPDAMRALVEYDWPGNVRELENCVERAVALNTDGPIRKEDLPTGVQAARAKSYGRPEAPYSMAEMERRAIEYALQKARNNKLEAARLLGIGKTTLYRKLKEYAVDQY